MSINLNQKVEVGIVGFDLIQLVQLIQRES